MRVSTARSPIALDEALERIALRKRRRVHSLASADRQLERLEHALIGVEALLAGDC